METMEQQEILSAKMPGRNSAERKNEIRIAVVEDDPMYRQAIEYYLRKIPGNRLFSFSSGEECFRYYHLLEPEIMILDYKLNDELTETVNMNGLDILQKVKTNKPEMEVIFLSGQENFDIATAAIKGGAAEYIVKDMHALARLQNEVARLALYIRMKRERIHTRKWTLAFFGAIVFLCLLIYAMGYFEFTAGIKILSAVLLGAALVFFLIKREKKRHSDYRSPRHRSRLVWFD